MISGIGTGGLGDPAPLELRIYRVKFFKMENFSFFVIFHCFSSKKYFNGIFLLLRNFPSKIFFSSESSRNKKKNFFFSFFLKIGCYCPLMHLNWSNTLPSLTFILSHFPLLATFVHSLLDNFLLITVTIIFYSFNCLDWLSHEFIEHLKWFKKSYQKVRYILTV